MHFFCLNKSKIITAVFVATFLLIVGVVVLLYVFKPYPLYYTEEISYASEKYGVSSSLIASVIFTESSFNPEAKSNRGAVGLMQILPSTAEWLCGKKGETFSSELLTNPLYNIELGTYYLSYLFQKFGDLDTVLASYNAGEGNVKLWLLNDSYSLDGEKLTTTPFKETNQYIQKVHTAKKFYAKKFKQ